MSSKQIKIQIDDNIQEYEVKEDKSLVIEIQNKNDSIDIYTSEKDYFTAFDQSKIDIFDEDYIPENHKSSILDVIYNNDTELEKSNIQQETETVELENDRTDEKDIFLSENSNVEENISHKKDNQEEQKSDSDIIDDMLNKYKNII